MSKLAQVIQHHWREAVPDDRLAHLVKDAARGLGRALQGRAEHPLQLGVALIAQRLGQPDKGRRRNARLRRHAGHRIQRHVVGMLHGVAGSVAHARGQAVTLLRNQQAQAFQCGGFTFTHAPHHKGR